jgi:hypothetical protein
MPKQFYTERDMDDLAQRGVHSLDVTDEVVLTQLAYERAKMLGIQLVQDHPENLPDAPLRPYISNIPSAPVKPAAAFQSPAAPQPQPAPASPAPGSLHDRILNAVHTQLGDQIETEMLENIIQRVLNSLGMK